MNLKQLLKIKSELDIFQEDLRKAIKSSKETPGYRCADGTVWSINNISGLHVNGQLRRSYLTLKYKLTRLFND